MIRRGRLAGLAALTAALPLMAAALPARATPPGACPAVTVPGAEKQVTACLADLTTKGTLASGHTDQADWSGLNSAGAVNPSGVPGTQIDGYFPDTSKGNTNHGWDHDAQFVIRLPERWNGGLVVAGSPGNRETYANDFTISDWALAKGYAYAATDKGNTGPTFYRDGVRPGDAVAEWNRRVSELAVAAKAVVRQRYGRPARTTIAAGQSNGGYLVRWQIENRPDLFDGGVDWEGTLFTSEGPNLLTFLPSALRAYAKGDTAGIAAAGFAPESDFLWPFHYQYYWDFTQRVFREEFDPAYDGDTEAGTPFCASGTPGCDTDYDYASRPAAVKQAMARVSLTGKIKKPLVIVHGTLDALLPIRVDSDVYAKMIADRHRDRLLRYYRVEDGTHVDSLYPAFPDRLRPLLPCFRSAFTALEAWIGRGTTPPPSATLPRPATGDLDNTCTLGATP
ncbi:3-hydroxybutyrate oligomer hydrolase family protein [Microbispora triticiradicis]|uniref:Tannase/feruloyl esterase family alpha/beta hydrolase n=2 Tax=Microbispora TaxID=2005 RepID=A0ABY3M487_9ACTN|nr:MULTISPECIES: 3-hydroxybutyrate oligomer hydrolase family protein [Microbispora]TLP56911.1 tannase/feruloyl esterase family alpha/beta hydrolase [Microbispora fusca]TYB66866.1 tannase/feruloyl esterase family alpha/beta hydrolase [Microbispora tritici]